MNPTATPLLTEPPEATPADATARQGADSPACSPRRQGAISKALALVEPSRRPAVQRRAADMPLSCRAGYVRAAAGKASPRAAIRAFCLECVGWERQEVGDCTVPACPLYWYRQRPGR